MLVNETWSFPGIELSRNGRVADDHHAAVAVREDDEKYCHGTNTIDDDKRGLNVFQAAALLTADVVGTGLLALPQDIKVLGNAIGLTFLVLCLPINFYAGAILSKAADRVELNEQEKEADTLQMTVDDSTSLVLPSGRDGLVRIPNADTLVRVVARADNSSKKEKSAYSSLSTSLDTADSGPGYHEGGNGDRHHNHDELIPSSDENSTAHHRHGALESTNTDSIMTEQHHDIDDDSKFDSTHDFIGMAQALFHHPRATHLAMAVFYGNIFLVLGDYILVMSHSVAAVLGEASICLPQAGILASTLMFAFCQLRTMANLGGAVTVLSLTSLFIVVVQCLVAAEKQEPAPGTYQPPSDTELLRKLSALSSIAFATGSNKLLLNIRYEMQHRTHAPKTLALSQAAFGTVYVMISVLAGPNPPSFLFDSIPSGLPRRMAGLLLWIHVSISYAINSQAICASMDRRFFHRMAPFQDARRRWFCLTLILIVSSYLVANVVPFFKDLVALIGALTSVPLTLLFPVLFHRRAGNMPLCCPTRQTLASYALLLFSLVFLVLGVAGSLGSIELDWMHSGRPFACTV